ncbi:hypothetical protein F442_16443 [Phytophthora nicotianae P10297]|uniref:Jacalin-type lectin domain-containing protein n=2 Tax=Phytophthora nicotianae TaxID=4792 RepID=V9EE25_PHYNI|nr:hypothetical protein F443_16601 [Phytophthora nicotianae P1569]ETP35332.1 hypothetical protein F442_16443 [Phytophthora nicotianae P10297]
MKFFIPVLTAVAFLTGGAAALDKGVLLGETFGGPHGHKYSDLGIISPGQITTFLRHGGKGGVAKTLDLAEDEHIIGIQAHWAKYYRHTRIMYIEFTTDAGNTISAGSPTDKIGKDSAPEGYQLGGFVGYSGNELDSVGAISTSIDPVE